MTTFVLFGGTGDLAKRKIIPALYSAFVNGRLDADFKFIGAARENPSVLSRLFPVILCGINRDCGRCRM